MKLKLALDADKCGLVHGAGPSADEMPERPGTVVAAPGAPFRVIATPGAVGDFGPGRA
ncbi:MAG: hypothetical protein PHW25_12860 [Zoogloea sp.]|uniref:hypothetical protein n=1 Tax=Zoogloea sp. TaxID=49181 RepID=UPI00260FD00C|nr:hypothetical protein [Zoogloea sp.]MDD3327962.1 hypothetical protein [Zoogloea sp.]